jgi:hypothetical protein
LEGFVRTASLEQIDPPGSQTGFEDLAEILEPADVSTTLQIPPTSKVDRLVLIGGLLVAFTVGAGFVLAIVQSRAAARPTPMVSKTVGTTVRPVARSLAEPPIVLSALIEPPIVPSTPTADRSSRKVARPKRITAPNSSSVDPAATPPAVESADDWVDPFDDQAEAPSDEWKDPFADSRGTR